MEQPSNLLRKLSQQLFPDPVQQVKFIDRLIHPQPYNPCILWCQPRVEEYPFAVEPAITWQPEFIDRLALRSQPGKLPLHTQGYYYCLDFSSVFAVSTVFAIQHPVHLIIDLCAAPGGKSIFAWRALHPQSLISNEVIGKRTGMLIANLKRCQIKPVLVSSLDAQILAQEIPQTADVVLVDAPCSGQSLLAKGGKAPGCFHPVSINKNANRQKRILANAASLVAPQGYLAYMTCTYSPAENEEVCDWFLAKFPQFDPVTVEHLHAHRSQLTAIPCYRMWPQDGLGAGAFTALFQNNAAGTRNALSSDFRQQPRLTVLD
jgi:16S rRNA C967 or C1407 C5-methylase (RsmB/RsmF family)